MPTYTSNLNLYKPSRLDADVEVDTSLAQNFQSIDDQLGPLINVSGSYTVNYNADDTVSDIVTPIGTTTFEYNTDGTVNRVIEDTTGQTKITTLNYDTEGNVQSIDVEVV